MFTVAQNVIQFYEKKRILVTGAGGYIGTRLIDCLSEVNCNLARFSRKMLSPKINSSALIEDVRGDLAAFDDWEKIIRDVDVIFHLAAQTGVQQADDHPVQDAEINVIGTLKLLEAAKKYPKKIIIAASSATSAGLQEKLPIDENAIDVPTSLYDLHKIMTEQYIHLFRKKNWVQGTCLRLSNVYGPGVKSSDHSRGVLNQIVRTVLQKKDIYVVNGGNFLRDYIYIDDVVQAFLLSAMCAWKLEKPYYFIGTGVGTTVRAAFQTVIDVVKSETNISVNLLNKEMRNASPIDQRNFVANSSAFSALTTWKPSVNLTEGIRRLIQSESACCV
ncbi:MAG: NAD-dependent epimerase/dehydratase [uncultured bacterium]|nr:MAG: NAD-dependent epimerase/dehydratase [uncultured bacterium]